jgi:hypothetical protein
MLFGAESFCEEKFKPFAKHFTYREANIVNHVSFTVMYSFVVLPDLNRDSF